ncbi:MAG TPA: signal peptidase I [Actinomycetota bacterium]|nr:signal peptidase I [Actinomycetota bacterium]
MPRVYEVARELGMSSRELMDRLEELGNPVASHSSGVDAEVVERLRSDGQQPVTARTERTRPVLVTRASRPNRGWLRRAAEVPLLVLFAFAIAVVIKTFLLQAFYIPSGSMFPTLRAGDRVLVEKVSYRLRDPRQGDVVVFAKEVFGEPPDVPWTQDVRDFFRELLGLPTGFEEDYIKRVVAVGGDTIRYSGTPRRLFVNGMLVDEPFINRGRDRSSPSITLADCERLELLKIKGGCRVPAGKVFVMGDNRGNSEDSRILGPIDEDKIIGHAFVIVWPLPRLGTL